LSGFDFPPDETVVFRPRARGPEGEVRSAGCPRHPLSDASRETFWPVMPGPQELEPTADGGLVMTLEVGHLLEVV